LNAEYDNPQFTVSLLAKFSRKLCEPNVFTKLKSLICLHKMMQECDSNAQNAFTQSVRSLKSERDEKVGVSFFSNESIEQAAGSASTVAELEAVELAREYAAYVLNFIDFRGEKPARSNAKSKVSKKEVDGDDRAEMLLELVELSELVQKCCKQSQSGQVVMQCLSCVMEDRPWITKQMQKVYEVRNRNILTSNIATRLMSAAYPPRLGCIFY
jgi:ANTH domain